MPNFTKIGLTVWISIINKYIYMCVYIYVGILCFEFEVFNFLFSNFSFKRLVLSNLTLVRLLPCSGGGKGLFNNASDTKETYLATMN